VKITAGYLGGRTVRAPPGEVRPTQDRVRQSVFSSLGGSCEGWRVLDLFAGSGSLGLEAWSRGASSVLFVEQDSRVLAHLRATIRELCPGKGSALVCRRADVLRWTWNPLDAGSFDLVFADPPYADARQMVEETLIGLARRRWVRSGGLAVMEMSSRDAAPDAKGWILIRDREFGETRITQYRADEGVGSMTNPEGRS